MKKCKFEYDLEDYNGKDIRQDRCIVKEQRIYISSNYETYLGKEFMNTEKLEELRAIMKSQAADTIGRAMAVRMDKR